MFHVRLNAREFRAILAFVKIYHVVTIASHYRELNP